MVGMSLSSSAGSFHLSSGAMVSGGMQVGALSNRDGVSMRNVNGARPLDGSTAVLGINGPAGIVLGALSRSSVALNVSLCVSWVIIIRSSLRGKAGWSGRVG